MITVKIPRKPGKKARIEIIPMIDTMFFLLVFFMLATLSMTSQSGVPVNLPQAIGIEEQVKQVATLSIAKDGKIYFNKEEIASSADALLRLRQQKLADAQMSVIINADRSVEHGQVVELLDAIQQSGLAKVAIAVHHEKTK